MRTWRKDRNNKKSSRIIHVGRVKRLVESGYKREYAGKTERWLKTGMLETEIMEMAGMWWAKAKGKITRRKGGEPKRWEGTGNKLKEPRGEGTRKIIYIWMMQLPNTMIGRAQERVTGAKIFKELGKFAMSEVSISENQVYGASINQFSEVLVTQSCPTLCDPRL